MKSPAPELAQQRLHRFVAVLFASAIPVIVVVELIQTDEWVPATITRFLITIGLGVWSVALARSQRPNSIPLVVCALVLTCVMVLLSAEYGVEATVFDSGTAFGVVMLYAVLVGTLAMGSRLAWSVSLAIGVAAWSVVLGLVEGLDNGAIATRAVVAIAGIMMTTGLVGDLYDQLNEAIAVHQRTRRLQNAVTHCSEALLVNSDSAALQEATRALLDATDADYAYIDCNEETADGVSWVIVAGASRRETEGQGEWSRGNYNATPSMFTSLERGEVVIVDTDRLDGSERELYERDGIQSEVCVPIFVGGEFRGSMGFVDYGVTRTWTDDEIQTLWRAAHMIGAYWRRQDDAESLKALNESKDKLLASVSHEIRTPLTAIVGLSEEIASNRASLGNDELDELTRIIAVQSRELAELVEDLLVASRADFGNLSIRPESTDLRDQVEMVIHGLGDTGATRSFSVEGRPAAAWADPLRVRQVLRNLVTNAVKYGGEKIGIDLLESDGFVEVVVSDSGPGVSEREAGLIFERYYRSAASPTQPGSVGIGLAVSRQLAEMMGGALNYVAGDGHHAFVLALPLAMEDVNTLLPEPA